MKSKDFLIIQNVARDTVSFPLPLPLAADFEYLTLSLKNTSWDTRNECVCQSVSGYPVYIKQGIMKGWISSEAKRESPDRRCQLPMRLPEQP